MDMASLTSVFDESMLPVNDAASDRLTVRICDTNEGLFESE